MDKLLEFGRRAMFYARVLSGYEERRIRSYRLQLEKRLQQVYLLLHSFLFVCRVDLGILIFSMLQIVHNFYSCSKFSSKFYFHVYAWGKHACNVVFCYNLITGICFPILQHVDWIWLVCLHHSCLIPFRLFIFVLISFVFGAQTLFCHLGPTSCLVAIVILLPTWLIFLWCFFTANNYLLN